MVSFGHVVFRPLAPLITPPGCLQVSGMLIFKRKKLLRNCFAGIKQGWLDKKRYGHARKIQCAIRVFTAKCRLHNLRRDRDLRLKIQKRKFREKTAGLGVAALRAWRLTTKVWRKKRCGRGWHCHHQCNWVMRSFIIINIIVIIIILIFIIILLLLSLVSIITNTPPPS
jgi:hypothetical protein